MKTTLSQLLDEVLLAAQGDTFWEDYLEQLISKNTTNTLHLAIFIEPYLQFILEGKKTVESRFSTRRFAPYNQVKNGDVVLLKRSSGPILGICQVSHAWFYDVDPESWEFIQKKFSKALCAQNPEFWEAREGSSYVTLMQIQNVKSLAPIKFIKRDRRGWVVLKSASNQLQLNIQEI